ncbi:Cyclin-like F-box [Cordyceps militaris]|uniref:Cyclin-like F-box n=1 Tax=Cordyceps militaris TaxID=73501 RepID=A0A2H4SKH1_CORMI|nr:Cyclin-like F-box [Cordyceps militaris]
MTSFVSPCCRNTEAAGFLASRHRCEWHSFNTANYLELFTLSQRIPRPRPGDISFKWHDHEILHLDTDIGSLGVFSIEILHKVLQQLDMATLARLQCVSQGMKRAVGSLPMLRSLLDHGGEVVRGIVATETGAGIVCQELYAKLCHPVCETCDDAGDYLYLLTCKRVCFDCLTKTYQYRPLRPMQALSQYGLDMASIRRLPAMTVPSYKYPKDSKRSNHPARSHIRRITGWILVDHTAVMDQAVRAHGSLANIRSHVHLKRAEKARRARRRRRVTMEIDRFEEVPGVETSLACAVKFPWLDRASSSTVGTPVICQECQVTNTDSTQWYYTETSFREHRLIKH